MSERTSDLEFVRLFSPRIIDRLPSQALASGVHIFRSPPGGGKTTLLRAFTPTALRAFWSARSTEEIEESFRRLRDREVLDEELGPQLLGVLLSCASGYADLPPGAAAAQEGLFRALLNCRIVLRTLRSLAVLLAPEDGRIADVKIRYDEQAKDLQAIPQLQNAEELSEWAEKRERSLYAELDLVSRNDRDLVTDHRFDGVLWLQNTQFVWGGRQLVPRRLLMIDDLHRLRRSQRDLLVRELTELRPTIAIWLAERSIALGEQLLSQGAREGRDLQEYQMDELWGVRNSTDASNTFSQILDRRLQIQNTLPPGTLAQYLSDRLASARLGKEADSLLVSFETECRRLQNKIRYRKWLELGRELSGKRSPQAILDLLSLLILIARDEASKQFALQLDPLPPESLAERDSSQVEGAAAIFANRYADLPYYFGIDKLCAMATNNIEELLSLAAALYEGLRAKIVLRQSDLTLSPSEQEKLLRAAARRKREFLPKTHTEGTRAARLLDGIGAFCREKTFLPTAPYAPGVTGVRLANSELAKMNRRDAPESGAVSTFRKVVSESVAENLLTARDSSPTVGREGGTVFYLNRTLCAYYGLPLQYGGWQDVPMQELIDWMERGRTAKRLEGV